MAKTIIQYDEIDMDYFNHAPTLIVSKQRIRCNSQQLFEIFEDANSWPIWAPSIAKIEWTSDKPFGVGTTRSAFLKGNIYAEEEFIDWDYGKSMAFKFTSGTVPAKAFGEKYVVSEVDDKSCDLVWTVGMSAAGISKIFMPITKPLMSWYLQSILAKLDKYAAQQYA